MAGSGTRRKLKTGPEETADLPNGSHLFRLSQAGRRSPRQTVPVLYPKKKYVSETRPGSRFCGFPKWKTQTYGRSIEGGRARKPAVHIRRACSRARAPFRCSARPCCSSLSLPASIRDGPAYILCLTEQRNRAEIVPCCLTRSFPGLSPLDLEKKKLNTIT
jgi:hypothetical protein